MTTATKAIIDGAIKRYKELGGKSPLTIRYSPSIIVNRDFFPGIRMIKDPNLSGGTIRLIPSIPKTVMTEALRREKAAREVAA